jgi:hypothetical protein
MFYLLLSINDETLKEEVQRRIDSVLQDIEDDYKAIPGPNVKSRWDFIYGYEYGSIVIGDLVVRELQKWS